MNDSEIITAMKALLSTGRPFDCDPRDSVFRVMIYADGRAYKGEGQSFAEAASRSVLCYRTKGDQ